MHLKLKNYFLGSLFSLFSICLLGCGGSHDSSHAPELVFKGAITKVQYLLTNGYTILTDAEGKTIQLHGFPAIPTGEVEIYKHGEHEYEVFQTSKS